MDNLERMRQQNYGQYSEVTVEKEFLKLTTTAARVVVHFSHKQFRRCEILDAHLKVHTGLFSLLLAGPHCLGLTCTHHQQALAPKYFSTRFIKIDVGNAPFFVEKLQIQVLPALFSFFNGVVIDRYVCILGLPGIKKKAGACRLIGFEEIGNTDNFKTEVLEKRLLNCGIVEKGAQQQQQQKQDAKSILNQMDNNYFDGDDFEGLDEA